MRGYDRDQYLQLCWALRDIQADRVFPIDHGLLDVLAGVQAWLLRSVTDRTMPQVYTDEHRNRTVVVTNNDSAYQTALALKAAGLRAAGKWSHTASIVAPCTRTGKPRSHPKNHPSMVI